MSSARSSASSINRGACVSSASSKPGSMLASSGNSCSSDRQNASIVLMAMSAERSRMSRHSWRSSADDRQLWRDMRERSADIAISTIDAFCLSLLHEFPLEANIDPGFELADETQAPRLMEEALDRALDIGRGLSRTDPYVRLLFAELRESRLREALE